MVRQEIPGTVSGVQDRRAEHDLASPRASRAAGKIPFCSTFAKFVVRAYDQVEMAIIGGANLKITGTHAGVTLAADGPSQMSLPDVAFFRSFCHAKNYNGRPAVSYFFPADAVSCYKITELMANIDGTCYQRAPPRRNQDALQARRNVRSRRIQGPARRQGRSSSSPPGTWFTNASRPPTNWPRAARKRP